MSPLSPRVARLSGVAVLTIATCATAASAATAPRPAAGEWIGTNRTEFLIRGGRIQQFENRCGPAIVPIAAIRVRADGRFSFDKRVSQPDGSRRRYRVAGRFSSAFDAKGKVRSPGCTAAFVARSQVAPDPEPAPEPAPDAIAPE